MGKPARFSLKPIGLTKAAQVVAGLKKLEKERLRMARLELSEHRSILRFDGHCEAFRTFGSFVCDSNGCSV